MAQKEAELISGRTKAAMAVLKARGVSFGRAGNLTPEAALRGAKKGAAKARDRAAFYTEELGPKVAAARASGDSFQAIADGLNADEYRTPTGKAWGPVQVSRVLVRYQSR